MERIRTHDGTIVEIEGDVWRVPFWRGPIGKNEYVSFNWSTLPPLLRRDMDSLGRLFVPRKGVRMYELFARGIQYLAKYIEHVNIVDTELCSFTETDWGSFAEWLEQSELGLDTRRGYFTGIRAGINLAVEFELQGYSEWNSVAIANAMRRRFRDANLFAIQRAAKRAWSERERDQLLNILRSEWLAWKDWQLSSHLATSETPDLLAVVAVYLCFEETIRPEELNVLTVEDIDFDNDRVFLHAPNKGESWQQFDRISKVMLQALVTWSEDARMRLGTRLLFVSPIPKPRLIVSRLLTKGFRQLLEKYAQEFPIHRPDAKLSDGRKTLGSILASETEDRELVRMTLRHKTKSTMHVYYVRQGKEQLSRNVDRALKGYATKLSMAYNRPILSPDDVPSELAPLLSQYPDHGTPYGPCTDEETLKKHNCEKKLHCGECPKLIPMASKLANFERERDGFLKLALQDKERGHQRGYENRIATAGMLQGHIINIERALKEQS